MSRLGYSLLLLGALGLTLFTFWLWKSLEPGTRFPSLAPRHIPDYFVSDFSATVYDADGQPYYKLKANHMEHFPDDLTVAITYPEITIMRPGDLPWVASADSGTFYESEDRIVLSGNVVLIRQAAQEFLQSRFKTTMLQINLNNKQASTKEEIEVTAKGSRLEAKGMQLDLDKGTLILQAQARGTYVPNP